MWRINASSSSDSEYWSFRSRNSSTRGSFSSCSGVMASSGRALRPLVSMPALSLDKAVRW